MQYHCPVADQSTYPASLDADMRADVLANLTPGAFRDLLARAVDAIVKVETALGAPYVAGGGGSAVTVQTDTDATTVLATGSYAALDDTDLRMTVPDGHATRVLVTFQAVPTCVDAEALVWMADDGSGTPLADMVRVATADGYPRPGLTCVQFVLDPAPVGEFQLRWGQMAIFPSDTNVSTSYGDTFGPAIMTWQDIAE